MHDIARFINGFKRFQKKYFCADSEVFDILKEGQSPKTLVIACIDSRVDPALITGCNPGDLLVVRNVGNLVPPYRPDPGHHGVSAALEFAVTRLDVEHIIVLGHSCCGGVKTLLERGEAQDSEFLDIWMSIADQARQQILSDLGDEPPEIRQRACEQATILVSLKNLLTFPWVKKRVEAEQLFLHGWYFDMVDGELLSYIQESGSFEPLTPKCEGMRRAG